MMIMMMMMMAIDDNCDDGNGDNEDDGDEHGKQLEQCTGKMCMPKVKVSVSNYH